MAEENDKSMVLINAERCEVIMPLPTGRRPTAVNISEKYVAAGNFQDNSVTIYERSALCEGKALTSGKTVMLDYLPPLTVKLKCWPHSSADISDKEPAESALGGGYCDLGWTDWVLVSGFDACFVAVIDIALSV